MPALPTTAGSAALTRFQGRSADGRAKSCNVASAVSMDCVVTKTSRDASAIGPGQAAPWTGEASETRIAAAANIEPMALGIVCVPTRSQDAKYSQECKGKSRLCASPGSVSPCARILLRNQWCEALRRKLRRGVELLEPRHHLAREQRHAVDRVRVLHGAGLGHHQKVPEAAGRAIEVDDLVVDLVGRAREHQPAGD